MTSKQPEVLSSPAFCVYPWTQLATTVSGKIRLCCHSLLLTDPRGKVVQVGREAPIESAWNGEAMKAVRRTMLSGTLPGPCSRCIRQEKQGVVSRRLNTLRSRPRWAEDIEERIRATSADGSLSAAPSSYDLRLGNTCNLRCVMCRPQLSTSWVQPGASLLKSEKIPTSARQHLQYPGPNGPSEQKWYANSDLVTYLIENASSIRQLYFAGGEPLLAQEHWRLLEELVGQGAAPEIDLSYDTNGTQITPETLKLWDNFRSLDLRLSMDGIGEKLEYIREGSSFAGMQRLMNLLGDWPYPRAEVRLLVTIQIFNALDLIEILDWYWSFAWTRARPNNVSIVWSFLEWPKCLSVGILPPEAKAIILKRVDEALGRISSAESDEVKMLSLKNLAAKLKYIFTLWAEEPTPVGEFVDYADALDHISGRRWREIFPELRNLVE